MFLSLALGLPSVFSPLIRYLLTVSCRDISVISCCVLLACAITRADFRSRVLFVHVVFVSLVFYLIVSVVHLECVRYVRICTCTVLYVFCTLCTCFVLCVRVCFNVRCVRCTLLYVNYLCVAYVIRCYCGNSEACVWRDYKGLVGGHRVGLGD